MVQVRATMKCFVGNCLRAAGEVFEFDGDLDPSSTVLVAVDPEPEPEPEAPKRRKRRAKKVAAPDWANDEATDA